MPRPLLVDLDDLVLTVRDRSSRSYILEAVNAYRAEAYRSAIISTWIAVAYDIISKVRELAGQGEPEAQALVSELDDAIEKQSHGDLSAIPRLQKVENDLLDKSLNKFEFLSRQEHNDLTRLKEDRNLCAHPAFTKQDLLFQPTPELVRSHIVHAVDHLLQHPPVQGKNAFARLKQDLLQPSFPTDQAAVTAFLRHKYLDHIKQSLLRNLITVFLKIVIKRSEPDLRGHEAAVVRCLAAVRQHSPAVFNATMADQIPKLTTDLKDTALKRVIRLFPVEPRVWGWLGEDLQIRLRTIVTGYAYDEGASDYLFDGFAIDELRPLLAAAVNRLDETEKVAVIRRSPRAEFIDSAFEVFKEAGSWRYAERLAVDLILPLSRYYSASDIERLLEIIPSNGQIYGASDMPDSVTDLFKRTDRLHATTRQFWEKFLQKQSRTHYPFHSLAQAMSAAGMTVPKDEDEEEDDD
ncbi:hypothetical protein J0H58_33785 [bacterium]|nr:hypothetical protein [bacterium]